MKDWVNIDSIDLPAELRRVRADFDRQLAEALRNRTHFTHAQIASEFGISTKVVRRVSRQFNISRRRSTKPLKSVAAK